MHGEINEIFVPGKHSLNIFFFRNEIASCIEKAYEKIALTEAARMLFFDNAKPMKDYAVQVFTGFSF